MSSAQVLVLQLVMACTTFAVAGEPVSVFVTIPPQAGIAERIGGEHVSVQVLVQPGDDPHTFEPTFRQMAALGRAKLYFRIGLPIEARIVGKVGRHPGGVAVVDMAGGIRKRRMQDLNHAPPVDGEHEHEQATVGGSRRIDLALRWSPGRSTAVTSVPKSSQPARRPSASITNTFPDAVMARTESRSQTATNVAGERISLQAKTLQDRHAAGKAAAWGNVVES